MSYIKSLLLTFVLSGVSIAMEGPPDQPQEAPIPSSAIGSLTSIDLSELPTHMFEHIAFWADRDRANLARSCKRVGLSASQMCAKMQEAFWVQVDSLLRCETIFDLTQTHFAFFHRIAQGFPLMFNLLGPDHLTALHRAVLGKKAIPAAFLLSMGARRDFPAMVTETDAQGNHKIVSKKVAALLEELRSSLRNRLNTSPFGQPIFGRGFADRFGSIQQFMRTLNSVKKIDQGRLNYLWVDDPNMQRMLDSCCDVSYLTNQVIFLDQAINFPNARVFNKMEQGKRIIDHCVQTEARIKLFDILRFAGADIGLRRPLDLYRLDASIRGLLLKRNIISAQELETAICDAALDHNDTHGISLEKLKLFLQARGRFDINASKTKENVLTKTLYCLQQVGSPEQLEDLMAKLEALFSWGADPFYEFFPTWDEDFPSVWTMMGKPGEDPSPPFIRFLSWAEVHLHQEYRTEYNLKFVDRFVAAIKDNKGIKPKSKHLQLWASYGMSWYKSPTLCAYFLENGVDPLMKTLRGETVLHRVATMSPSEEDDDVAIEVLERLLPWCRERLTEEQRVILPFQGVDISQERLTYLLIQGFRVKSDSMGGG